MAAGDGSRIWFEELKEEVREKWAKDITIEKLISVTDHLNSLLQRNGNDNQL